MNNNIIHFIPRRNSNGLKSIVELQIFYKNTIKGWIYIMNTILGILVGALFISAVVLVSKPVSRWFDKFVDKLFKD